MATPRIERLIAQHFFPTYANEEPEEYYRKVEEYVAVLKRKGATHVMVNEAVVSIPWAMDPTNSYLRFSTYGHTPDKFVASTYSVDIYHEPLMAKNRELLLKNVKLARQYGFRCAIRCVEPTFMPESFFQRYPDLRGPRVDNPACSTKPLYALCPMVPQVQDHYRQLIRKLLELAPEIDEMHLFTNDSGAGVCYSTHMYAGPNGPWHCHQTPPGKQAQVFARVLAEAGREINTDFRVVMTSGLGPKEKEDFIEGSPEGVTSSVYGAFAWGGGLEDRWGTMAVGPAVFDNPTEREKVRAWALADYRARIEPLKKAGCPVYASYNSNYYNSDDPRPYETHSIICTLLEMGVTSIIGGGPGVTPYSVNTAVIRRAMEQGSEPAEVAVTAVATAWVGADFAPALCEVWRLTDHVSSEAPVLAAGGHAVMNNPLIRHMPIVPDEGLLGEDDLAYFMTPVLEDKLKMRPHQGGVWRILHYDTDVLLAYIRQYESVVFPSLTSALASLNEMLATDNLPGTARACLAEQRENVADQDFAHRRLYHLLLAALHKIAGHAIPGDIPSLAEIIDREIALQDAAVQQADTPRIRLMREHRHDPLQRVDLSEFPTHRHTGTAGWEGAHERRESVPVN
ncbi:MAG: hypothetical protein ACYDBB_11895 [Armatimonadota bacterium]